MDTNKKEETVTPVVETSVVVAPASKQKRSGTVVAVSRLYCGALKKTATELDFALNDVKGLLIRANNRSKWIVDDLDVRLKELKGIVVNTLDSMGQVLRLKQNDELDNEIDLLVRYVFKLTSELNTIKGKTMEQLLSEHFKGKVAVQDIRTFLKCMLQLSKSDNETVSGS